jgi:hypothetical protein
VGRAWRHFVYLSHHVGGGIQKKGSLVLDVGRDPIHHLKFLIHASILGC